MEKIFKILVVFGLLMLVIIYSVRAREKKFRDYYFNKQMDFPHPGDPDWDLLSEVVAGEEKVVEATDRENELFFLPGEGTLLLVYAEGTGIPMVTLTLGERTDALAFDPVTRLLFSYSREGLITIIRQAGKEHYKIVQRLPVPRGGRGLLNDPLTGRIYLPVGESVFVYGNE